MHVRSNPPKGGFFRAAGMIKRVARFLQGCVLSYCPEILKILHEEHLMVEGVDMGMVKMLICRCSQYVTSP
jgi:hypothetical protein